MKRRSSLAKSRLQEVQCKMMWPFLVAMMSLFFAVAAGGCAAVSFQSGNWLRAVPLVPVAGLFVWPMVVHLRVYLRLVDEEDRLLMQQPEFDEG